jgi:pyruvate kinase
MRRQRKAKILATLGPASSSKEMIRELFRAGADVFRLNFSHGSHDDHRASATTRSARSKRNWSGRSASSPTCRDRSCGSASLEGGEVTLKAGQSFRLDLDETPGDAKRAPLPHPEIFAAISSGTSLLIDDGKLRLEVQDCTPDYAEPGW